MRFLKAYIFAVFGCDGSKHNPVSTSDVKISHLIKSE